MLLKRNQAVLVVVDIQERLANAMARREEVVRNTAILAQAARRLGVPILSTVQYTKGLGPMVAELDEPLSGITPYEKLSFDCCGAPEFLAALAATGSRQVLLTGMETHVCVLQTAASLLAAGYQVHVPMDAVCSRTDENKLNGLERLRRGGAEITNTESALFEMLGAAGTPEFKELSKLIR